MKTAMEELSEGIEALPPGELVVEFHSGTSLWGTDWLKVSSPSTSITIALTKDGEYAIFPSPAEECDQPEETTRRPEDVLDWVEDHFSC